MPPTPTTTRRRNDGDDEHGAEIFEILDRVDAINLVRKSSKSELSSRFFGRLKFFGCPKNQIFENLQMAEKAAQTAWILMIFGPNWSRRHELTFSKFSVTFRAFRLFKIFSWDSLGGCDLFGPKIVKIRAIFAIFRPFKDFVAVR